MIRSWRCRDERCSRAPESVRRASLRLGVLGVGLLILAGCGSSGSGGSTKASTATTTAATPATVTGGSTSMSAPSTVTASSGGVTATMQAGSHHPRVGVPWPVSFTATRGGRPARASVSYEYLFAGQVVARRSHYLFTGHFSDTFKWPASAVGYPLSLRAVIVSGPATLNLDYAVQVTT